VFHVILISEPYHALKENGHRPIDKPEHPITFVDTKSACGNVIGDSTPSGSLQDDTPTAGQQKLIYRNDWSRT
jgi:hypothetical protein